ncbi:hypothetical protein CTheo_4527 [Ceratobasidium theobromae]|uniref:DUF7918 domain-containing protein n=1 Tax=Ceratobasidium theobromae TaxID=1582974 RepID=A0A5N5QKD6_9AGAM|nr:hypothetical protein CTheo_4527 [Ceratobasidium theobromae]
MIQGMISAWITTELGVALPEFNVQHAEGRVDCWIPSVQGTNFCINWHSLNPSSFGLRGDIWLDGVPVGGGLLMPNETRGIKMTGHAAGNTSERPYYFGKQQLTDDENLSDPTDPRLSELNTIRLVLDWVYVVGEREFRQSNAPSSLGPIHEKAAKKAHGDSAGLGDLRSSTARQWYSTQSIGMKKTVLVFHYAPEDWLLAKKIISAPLNLKAQLNARSLKRHSAKAEDKKRRPIAGGPIDWFGTSSSGSTSGTQTASGSAHTLTHSPQSRSAFDSSDIRLSPPSQTRKRTRQSETPEIQIYDGDDDVVEQMLLNLNPSPPKRPRAEMKYEPFNLPAGSFISGEVIDLTGDDSD